jgi:hypothetical protein
MTHSLAFSHRSFNGHLESLLVTWFGFRTYRNSERLYLLSFLSGREHRNTVSSVLCRYQVETWLFSLVHDEPLREVIWNRFNSHGLIKTWGFVRVLVAYLDPEHNFLFGRKESRMMLSEQESLIFLLPFIIFFPLRVTAVSNGRVGHPLVVPTIFCNCH